MKKPRSEIFINGFLVIVEQFPKSTAFLGLGCLATGLLALKNVYDHRDEITLKYVRSLGPVLDSTGAMQPICAQVFFRHGARTPLRPIEGMSDVMYKDKILMKESPLVNVPYEVVGIDGNTKPPSEERSDHIFEGGARSGLLTRNGQMQAFELGQRLAARFITKTQMISGKFDPNKVYIRATNMQRTVNTLRGVLGGMFDARSFNKPVIIPCSSFSEEILFPNGLSCEAFRAAYMKSNTYMKNSKEVQNLNSKIKKHLPESDNDDIMLWRDHLIARKAHYLSLKPWMKELLPEIEELAIKILKVTQCGLVEDRNQVLPMAIGPIFDLICTNFSTLLNDQEKGRLYLYSLHDSTLTSMLGAFGYSDEKWPPFCADITIELLENDQSQQFVRINYCGKKILPKNGSEMKYEDFEKLMRKYRLDVVKYKSMCSDKNIIKHMQNS